MATELKLINGEYPTVLMTLHAKRKMDLIIHSVTTEIGWLGFVERLADSEYLVTDVFIPKQEVNGGTCEITEEGLVEMANEILDGEDGVVKMNQLRLWGHSHANMGTSPSGQDSDQMKIFTKNVDDFFIRLIANKRGDYNFTIFEYDRNLITEEAPSQTVTDEDEALAAEVKETVKTNVKELTYHTKYYNQSNGYGGCYGGEARFWEYDEKLDGFVKGGTQAYEKALEEKAAIGFQGGKPPPLPRQQGNKFWGMGGAYDIYE
jgi:hypothetical protein